jgi:hypothetical protein
MSAERHPYPSADIAGVTARPSAYEALRAAAATAYYRLTGPKPKVPLTLDLIGGGAPRPLTPSDLPLVFPARNDRAILPSLLAHYRRLGVTRFICVDDRSDDGTREFLCEQPDVDVYQANVRFQAALAGRFWRMMLFRRYGMNRWYVSIDTDEFMIYQDHNRVGLAELARILERRGIWRLPAPMIDAYPAGRLTDAAFDGRDGRMPWQVAGLIDGSDYTVRRGTRALSVEGGVRRRLFGVKQELIKYPLIYWTERCGYAHSIHQPLPFGANLAPIYAVLLHFKFFADAVESFKAIVRDGQYYKASKEYAAIVSQIESPDTLTLEYGGSIPIGSAEELMRRGFFLPWR